MTNLEFEQKFLVHRELVTSFFKNKYRLKKEEIEDLVQIAFIKIHKRFVNNDLDCEFPKKYLFSTLTTCLFEYKTRKLYMKHESTFTDYNLENHEAFLDLVNELDFSQVPDVINENKIIRQELELLINKLAENHPEMAQAIKMCYFDEMSMLEIAQVLNMPVNTIKTKLHRGKNKIRQFLKEDMVLASL
jgi:RNA polymerase sigma-70 factor (ECF subfamily)